MDPRFDNAGPLSDIAQSEYQTFYSQIERHWSWRRGNQIIVSPLEFEAVEAWFRDGVPLQVVLRAIDVFIERRERNNRRRSFLLNHLDGTLEKVHKEYISLHQGEGEGVVEGQSLLTGKLVKLVAKIKKLAKSYPDHKTLFMEMVARLDDVKVDQVVGYEEIDKELAEMNAALLARFQAQLSEDELAEIRQEVEEVVTEEEDPTFFQKVFQESVRSFFGLPRFTVLG